MQRFGVASAAPNETLRTDQHQITNKKPPTSLKVKKDSVPVASGKPPTSFEAEKDGVPDTLGFGVPYAFTGGPPAVSIGSQSKGKVKLDELNVSQNADQYCDPSLLTEGNDEAGFNKALIPTTVSSLAAGFSDDQAHLQSGKHAGNTTMISGYISASDAARMLRSRAPIIIRIPLRAGVRNRPGRLQIPDVFDNEKNN